MEGFDPKTSFGCETSKRYVAREAQGDEDETVAFLAQLAGQQRALQVDMGRRYALVYLVYNTIGNLLTQDEQVRCFENAARHLTDDGVFVLECRMPTASTRTEHQFVDAEHTTADHVTIHIGRYDRVSPRLFSRQPSSSRTSRSLRAKASGWPAYPDSPPRKPP